MSIVAKPKYKVCKTCGNRNHPASGQCGWCGARLRSPADAFWMLVLILIVILIIGLLVYSTQVTSPLGFRLRLPRTSALNATN